MNANVDAKGGGSMGMCVCLRTVVLDVCEVW